MTKVALLIGVSEYEPGLNPLPSAARDIEAMQAVLLNPEIGGFAETDVITLKNPDRQAAEEAIERLFAARQRDDLVLFYFSGHGIKDDLSNLYLSTRTTRKDSNGRLVRSTAVSAKFVHQCMDDSRSRRQVIILDSCFSGAFAEGMLAKDDDAIDIREQLGGEGRVVLASSSSTQYSFEEKKSGLSIYTDCMVEGMTTGEADQNRDGFISIHELHDHLREKLKERCPSMHPEIYPTRESYNIKLSRAKIFDPELIYRQEVFSCVNQGAISTASQKKLDTLRLRLKLSIEAAAQINDDVLRPYREQHKKLQSYREEYIQAAQDEYPISPLSLSWVLLEGQQKQLELQDQDVQPIQQQVNAEFDQKLEKKRQEKLAQYEKEFSTAFQKDFRLRDSTRNRLKQIQDSLDLNDEDVKRVEKPFLENRKREDLKTYEKILLERLQEEYPLSAANLEDLRALQQYHNLDDEDIAKLTKEAYGKSANLQSDQHQTEKSKWQEAEKLKQQEAENERQEWRKKRQEEWARRLEERQQEKEMASILDSLERSERERGKLDEWIKRFEEKKK